MKKILCAAVAVTLAVACSACGEKTAQENNLSQLPPAMSTELVEWKVDNDTITFTGSTRMVDYNTYEVENESIPWFSEKDDFSSVVISSGVTYIGNFSFYNFDDIESAEIAGSVDSIGSSAFSSCDNLKSVSLSDGIREIGMGAFGSCVSLEEINIPETVTTIGKGAFYGCSSLTDLTIPASVQVFGDADIFTGCTSLTIHCVEGSEAHTQAEKYGIPFDFNV